MTIRVAAIGVTHWHSLYDNAYLPQLAAHGRRPASSPFTMRTRLSLPIEWASLAVTLPPTPTTKLCWMQEKPDFVVGLGRHDQMAEIAHALLDRRIPFIMEKPMSHNARQLRGVLEKAVKLPTDSLPCP